MKKPFYKRPLFWVFAPMTLVVVLALDAIQLAAGTAWLNRRADMRKPANQAAPTMPSGFGGGFVTTPSYQAKPGEWQVPQPNPMVLDSAPPQATVLPTKFGPNSEFGRAGWGMRREDKAIGIGMPVRSVVQAAYKWQSPTRTIYPDQLPSGQYDYIANLPTGAFEALQEEVKKKLGLVAQREKRPMDGFVPRVNNNDAPGLKPAQTRTASQSEPDMIHYSYASISILVANLENMLGKPVVDETGLTGNFDIRYPRVRRTSPVASSEQIEQTRKMILENLGLDLIATNAPTEVLVVKKVNP